MMNNTLFGMIGPTLKIIFDFSRLLPEGSLKCPPISKKILKASDSELECQLKLQDSE
jgi:hypothetical protein